jgi:hypothetical protein
MQRNNTRICQIYHGDRPLVAILHLLEDILDWIDYYVIEWFNQSRVYLCLRKYL